MKVLFHLWYWVFLATSMPYFFLAFSNWKCVFIEDSTIGVYTYKYIILSLYSHQILYLGLSAWLLDIKYSVNPNLFQMISSSFKMGVKHKSSQTILFTGLNHTTATFIRLIQLPRLFTQLFHEYFEPLNNLGVATSRHFLNDGAP